VSGRRIGARETIPDFSLLIIFLALDLAPWIPFIRYGVGGSQITYPSFGQDQMHYVARAFAIWQGKNPAEAFTSTNSALRDGMGNFAELVFFLPSKLIGVNQLSFPDYFYSVLFISSFLSLASCFYFFKFLTKSRIIAASVTLVFLFFSQALDLHGIHFSGLPIFNRWPTPIFHYFLIFLILRILLDQDLKYRKILGAIIFAFSFYLYLYSWQTLAALIASAILVSIINRNSAEAKQLFVMAAGGVLLATPVILAILQLMLSSRLNSVLQFAFREQESHTPILDKMALTLCLLAITAWIYPKFTNRIVLHFVCLSAFAGIIVSNQQIFTGKKIQPGHFHWYFIAPAFFSALTVMLLQHLKNRNFRLAVLLILIGAFGVNQLQAISSAQEEARTQIASGLSGSEIKFLRGSVFTLNPIVLDQLATSYESGLYWHPFGIYYSGSQEVARESVAFSAIWLGVKSPIKLPSLQIRCTDFHLDPCATARMLLGSETNLDWFQYVADGNPVQQTLSEPSSSLAKTLRSAAAAPDIFFSEVIENRKIQTMVLDHEASQDQRKLLGSDWNLRTPRGKFWIYTRLTS